MHKIENIFLNRGQLTKINGGGIIIKKNIKQIRCQIWIEKEALFPFFLGDI